MTQISNVHKLFPALLQCVMLYLCLAGLALPVQAGKADDEIRRILEADTPPAGVVFEIIGPADKLRRAIPAVTQYAEKLRKRFPGIGIAVVSHGNEQFALLAEREQKYAEVHRQVRDLSGSGIPVHVCETYADMKGFAAEQFPSYVDVAPEGPAQIRNYEELGYQRIEL